MEQNLLIENEKLTTYNCRKIKQQAYFSLASKSVLLHLTRQGIEASLPFSSSFSKLKYHFTYCRDCRKRIFGRTMERFVGFRHRLCLPNSRWCFGHLYRRQRPQWRHRARQRHGGTQSIPVLVLTRPGLIPICLLTVKIFTSSVVWYFCHFLVLYCLEKEGILISA